MEMLQCNLDKIKNITPGNNAFPTQIITLFLSDTPKSIENAKKALEQNDFQQVYANIHKIKPSIIMVGVPDGTLQLVLSINENTKKKYEFRTYTRKIKTIRTRFKWYL
jgi:HPt (histidine-containing phosphotransfer) domain-containing protein